MLRRVKAGAFCTSRFWLWLTEKEAQIQMSLQLQKVGHPLTHFPSCWKTFLETTWGAQEWNWDCVGMSPASWPRLPGLFMPSTQCLQWEPSAWSISLSLEPAPLLYPLLDKGLSTAAPGKLRLDMEGVKSSSYSPGPLGQPAAVCAEAAASRLWPETQGCTGFAGSLPGEFDSLLWGSGISLSLPASVSPLSEEVERVIQTIITYCLLDWIRILIFWLNSILLDNNNPAFVKSWLSVQVQKCFYGHTPPFLITCRAIIFFTLFRNTVQDI